MCFLLLHDYASQGSSKAWANSSQWAETMGMHLSGLWLQSKSKMCAEEAFDIAWDEPRHSGALRLCKSRLCPGQENCIECPCEATAQTQPNKRFPLPFLLLKVLRKTGSKCTYSEPRKGKKIFVPSLPFVTTLQCQGSLSSGSAANHVAWLSHNNSSII